MLMRGIVFQGRCFTVPANADHDCIPTSWAECGLVESLDRVLQDASERCACADYVDGRRARFVIYGNFIRGKSLIFLANCSTTFLFLFSFELYFIRPGVESSVQKIGIYVVTCAMLESFCEII